MQGFSFSDRSFGNDCRMMLFLVLASFRGQTKKDEGERDEKSGMVFYGGMSMESWLGPQGLGQPTTKGTIS